MNRMSTIVVSRRKAAEIIRGLEDGRFFTVIFKKRGDDSIRVMNCRQRVRKYLAGGPAAYNFNEKGLVSVFDMQKMEYRCFPLDALIELRVCEDIYIVDHNKTEIPC